MSVWLVQSCLLLLLALVILVPLGHQVLRRNIVFIDMALAQASVMGVLIVFAFYHNDPFLKQVFSSGVSIGCGLIIYFLTKRSAYPEATIGLIYALLVSVGFVVAFSTAHGHEVLSQLLSADILWVETYQVVILLFLAAMTLTLSKFAQNMHNNSFFFHISMSLIVSFLVPVMGLLVLFTCLVGPALWMNRLRSFVQVIALGYGAGLLGLMVSYHWDIPTGSSIAAAFSVLGIASCFTKETESFVAHTGSKYQ